VLREGVEHAFRLLLPRLRFLSPLRLWPHSFPWRQCLCGAPLPHRSFSRPRPRMAPPRHSKLGVFTEPPPFRVCCLRLQGLRDVIFFGWESFFEPFPQAASSLCFRLICMNFYSLSVCGLPIVQSRWGLSSILHCRLNFGGMECKTGDSRSLPKDRICQRECSIHVLPSLSIEQHECAKPNRGEAFLAPLALWRRSE
jgi:hypothetical protein